jgi:hypothetical protein
MRLFELFLIPVLLVTGSIASGQEPSALKLQGRPKKISGDWAASPTAPGTVIVPTGGVEGVPGGPMPGDVIGAPVYGTPMGQCGASGCGSGACGATCDTCGRGGCLSRIKDWLCSRPLHACDKQVCYDPIPPLYQFFPCPREGYCPRLAPPTCCPPPNHLAHPICSGRSAWENPSCGCGSLPGTSSCGSCSSCESGRGSWTRFFAPLRCSSCKDHCCTPSSQCFTNGQVTGGCADGNCGPK